MRFAIVAAVFLVGAGPALAQDQQPATITASCNGTSKYMVAAEDAKPDPITNLGIIVNLADRSVSFEGYRVPIEKTDSTLVSFHGEQALTYGGRKLRPITVDGSIDRQIQDCPDHATVFAERAERGRAGRQSFAARQGSRPRNELPGLAARPRFHASG
jgi:hypothetical protein